MSEVIHSALIFGWSWPTIEQWRDFWIVVYGFLGAIAFFLFILLMLLMIRILWGIRGSVRDLIEDPVKPTLEEVRKTAASVRGTSEFIADTTVNPLIRIAAITRGVQRGISSITGIRARRK